MDEDKKSTSKPKNLERQDIEEQRKNNDRQRKVLKESLEYKNKLGLKDSDHKLEKKIKKSLIKRLSSRGYTPKENPYIFDKVEDYVFFFKVKNALIKDLEERGLVVEWNNSETSKGKKLNESLAMFLKIDTQMLNILKFFDLKPIDQELKEGDEDIEL